MEKYICPHCCPMDEPLPAGTPPSCPACHGYLVRPCPGCHCELCSDPETVKLLAELAAELEDGDMVILPLD